MRLSELPAATRPATPQEAYRCQARFVEQLGRPIGYKIACTNAVARRFLNMPEPFYGRLLAASTFDSPARIAAGGFFMRIIESEFAFQFARDLPPSEPPLDRQQIADALAGVLPGIEIVDSRFTSWTTVGAPALIADNACHGAWVKGALLTDWRLLDLAAQAVELRVNGNVVQRGSGSAVLGHPLHALEWLVHRLHSQGIGLKAGDYVTTGVTTDIYDAQAGDHLVADFGPLGAVELQF
ncbi:MAG: fumarylacetoacetate hydrolase family protein [Acidobacteriota bacterium]|nr:fumarylacetoacetate hydrolase family protein [Acidobacteriota bacterium]